MGVWIEIWLSGIRESTITVTPCMGVWIEIFSLGNLSCITSVTPCMGVWIEIASDAESAKTTARHSLYGSVD